METAVYKQAHSDQTALLLQQISIPSKCETVIFACVGFASEKGRAGAFCEKAVDIFRDQFDNQNLAEHIGQYLFRTSEELSYAAYFFKGGQEILYHRGYAKAAVSSCFLLKSRIRMAACDGQRGALLRTSEKRGILLATDIFFDRVKESEIGELFWGRDTADGERLQEKLEAICGRSEYRGADIAAIAIR